jgi:hypothetical protein
MKLSHAKALEYSRKQKVIEYAAFLKVMRFLATQCTKKFDKVLDDIKKGKLKEPIDTKKPKLPIGPKNPIITKLPVGPKNPIVEDFPVPVTTQWKYTSWSKLTSESRLWKGINFEIIFNMKESSVEQYAVTIQQNFTKFSKVDQILINKCF